jgi:protoporphyrinogen oxidase
MKTDIVILGGGIAGLSLASFIDRQAIVLESQKEVGGLSRSYDMNGVAYDIGPHIIFSKNKQVLGLHTTMIETNRLRRSNKILYKGRYVKYPFENDLAALDADEKDYCLKEFLSNPYENYRPANMLQFFLSTFGEGITRLYLQPYNEKIWKFDPAFMDTQMVERIPKPPAEDVIKSANGIATEGYTHQLYFHYPKAGGFQTLVNAYRDRAVAKGQRVHTGVQIQKLQPTDNGWLVHTNQGAIEASQIVNCMPLHELFKLMDTTDEARCHLDNLKYNSIYIILVQVKKDALGDNFGVYVPEKNTIFHRLNKLNFLGDNYKLPNDQSTLMAEVTFRPGSYLASLPQSQIVDQVIDGLVAQKLIERGDVIDTTIRYERYAYVIYDLDHRRNADGVLNYLVGRGIHSAGRFAQFEYLNTDGVVEQTIKLAGKINLDGPR